MRARGAQEGARGAQDGPKMTPGRPQDSPSRVPVDSKPHAEASFCQLVFAIPPKVREWVLRTPSGQPQEPTWRAQTDPKRTAKRPQEAPNLDIDVNKRWL